MSENEEADEELINPTRYIEEARANPRLPPVALAMIEQTYADFTRHLSLAPEPEILWQAYGFGLIVGSNIAGKEDAPIVMKLAASAVGSPGGKKSGEKSKQKAEAWHPHAREKRRKSQVPRNAR